MIKLTNISISFGEQRVLSNIDLTVPEKGIMLISGPSGCGKTTLLRIIAGLTLPDAGERTTDGEKISYVFQEDRLLPWFSARKNVALCSSEQQADIWLDRLGMSEHKNKLSAQLSGGMRRRAALARALAYNGDVLLLDEPFTGLDRALRKDVLLPIMVEYSASCPVVMVTHESTDIDMLSDCISMIYEL